MINDADRSDACGAFGPVLRRLRFAARLSQEELAERARLSVASISALERGRRRAPYRETIRLLGDALKLSDEQRLELESAAKRMPLPEAAEPADGSDSVAVVTPVGSSNDGLRHNLPTMSTQLIGRDDDVASVVALMRNYRMVTLLGTGGIGKTRTALAAGVALLATATAGVWLVDLAPLARGSFVAEAVASALGVQESADRPLTESLLTYLKARRAVLIFDNCEHVIAEAAKLASDLLRGCEHLKILATSREPLRLSGERVYRLPSLAISSALALFLERARAANNSFVLDDTNTPVVAEICRLLDGIALAIELAAARASMLSPAALLDRLDQRFRILTGGDRSALPRHQTLRALINWSYDLLTTREQRLFERLSVFAGGCDLAEAEVVCSDDGEDPFSVLEVLMSLVDKSLVMASSNGSDLRYRLLESSRLYASEKLAEHGGTHKFARRHAQAFLQLAEELEKGHDVAPDTEWLARAAPEFENWRTALTWSFGAGGDIGFGQRTAGALRSVWVRLAPAEGRRRIDVALARATRDTPPEVTLKLRLALANIALVSDEFAAALEISTQLIDIYAAVGDSIGKAFASCYAGASLASMGRSAEAEPMLTSALHEARAQGKMRLTGWLLQDIAYCRTLGPNPAEARPYYAEARDIWIVIGAKSYAANAAELLAENLFVSGEFESALSSSCAAVADLRVLGHTRLLVNALNAQAAYLNAVDRWSDARASASEALSLAEESELAVPRMLSLQHLAATAALSSNGDVAQIAMSAHLLGCVDAQLAAYGSFRTTPEQQEYDRVRAAVNAATGAEECENLLVSGASVTPERAINLGRSL